MTVWDDSDREKGDVSVFFMLEDHGSEEPDCNSFDEFHLALEALQQSITTLSRMATSAQITSGF